MILKASFSGAAPSLSCPSQACCFSEHERPIRPARCGAAKFEPHLFRVWPSLNLNIDMRREWLAAFICIEQKSRGRETLVACKVGALPCLALSCAGSGAATRCLK
jgi:hypothetical protein